MLAQASLHGQRASWRPELRLPTAVLRLPALGPTKASCGTSLHMESTSGSRAPSAPGARLVGSWELRLARAFGEIRSQRQCATPLRASRLSGDQDNDRRNEESHCECRRRGCVSSMSLTTPDPSQPRSDEPDGGKPELGLDNVLLVALQVVRIARGAKQDERQEPEYGCEDDERKCQPSRRSRLLDPVALHWFICSATSMRFASP